MRPLIIVLSLFLLAACQTTPIEPTPPPLDFSGAPYRLNVARITVAQDYASPKHAPNVEQLFDPSPAKAVKKWVETRLVAVGHDSMLEVNIKNASVIRTDIPKQKTGIEGLVTKEQTEQYTGTLEVSLKVYSNSVLPVAHTDVSAHQSLTLREDATEMDRENLYRQMTYNLMQALQVELDKNIHQYLSNYVIQ